MKIIISHDVDHLSVSEHIFRDLIVPKYVIWSLLELVKRKISPRVFFRKLIYLTKPNAWNNLERLLEFDKQNGVVSTFFVAVNNGKGLSYPLRQAQAAIDIIKKQGFKVGLHGICYDDYKAIKKEHDTFKQVSNLDTFGIRMHYLRRSDNTLNNLAQAGYAFDTSILSDKLDQQYTIAGLIEVPFHIMDSNLLGPRASLSLQGAQNQTIELLDAAEQAGKNYVAILFHPRYFGQDFPQHRNWYIWLIDYCKKKQYKFVDLPATVE